MSLSYDLITDLFFPPNPNTFDITQVIVEKKLNHIYLLEKKKKKKERKVIERLKE